MPWRSSQRDCSNPDLKDLAGKSETAAQSVPKVVPAIEAAGDAAAKAAPAMQEHADATTEAADAASVLGTVLPALPNYLDHIATSAEVATPQIGAFTDEMVKVGGGPIQDAKRALADASLAFADLQRSAGATPEALAAASQAVVNASKVLQKLQDDANGAGDSLKGSFHDLNISSQKDLQDLADKAQTAFNKINASSDNTAAGLANKQNAFLAYAQKALAASAQLDQGARDSTNAQLESQASILGVTGALKDLETQSAHSAAAVVSDADRQTRSFAEMRKTALANAGAFSGGGGGGDNGGQPPLDEAAKKAGDEIKSAMSEGGESLAQFDNALANTRAGFLAISDAAANTFDKRFKDAFDLESDSTGLGFGRVIAAMADAVRGTNEELANSRNELNGMIADINGIGTASKDNFGHLLEGVGDSVGSLEALKQELEDGTLKIGILGKADLSPLLSAIDAAISRAQQLAQAAKQANDQFDSIGESLQDRLDQATGNLEAVENRRFQKELADLKAAADAAGKLGDAKYRKDVDNANKLHDINLKNIEEELRKKSGGTGGGSSGADSTPGAPAGGRVQFGGGAGTFNLHLHIDSPTIIGNDLDKAGEQLAGPVLKQLKSMQGRNVKNILTGRNL